MKKRLIRLTVWIFLSFILFSGCTQQTPTVSQEKKDLGKVLIVYYSWGGNTHNLAVQLQKETGGDLCRLETRKKYLPFPEIYQEAKEEISNAYLPELENPIPDVDAYDLILIGSPVWWYSVAPAVLTFLSQCDFKKKPVALFSTHEGDIRGFEQTFEKAVKNAKILSSEGIHFKLLKDEEKLNAEISSWIEILTMELNS